MDSVQPAGTAIALVFILTGLTAIAVPLAIAGIARTVFGVRLETSSSTAGAASPHAPPRHERPARPRAAARHPHPGSRHSHLERHA